MKKMVMIATLMATVLVASAKDYEDTLVSYDVSKEMELGTSTQTLTITQAEDGTYQIEMLNWHYVSDVYGTQGQGSISASGLTGVTEDGVTTIDYSGTVTAQKGTMAGVMMWNLAFGGAVDHDATISLKFNDEKAYMEIVVQPSGMSGGGTGVFGNPDLAPSQLTTLNAASTTTGVYNLNGQKLEKAQPGYNVVNGKKMLVK